MRAAYLASTPRSRQVYWISVFLLLLAASLLGLYAFLFSPDWLQTAGLMPVALHSPLRADYSADLRGMRPISIGLGLIGDAARDQAGEENYPRPELIALLQTPVSTAVSFLAATNTSQPAAPVTSTPTQEEVQPPGSSPTPPQIPTSTRTIKPPPTFTVTPSTTKPPRLPTATLILTQTQAALPSTPTATRVPPTATPLNPTPTPLPTRTDLPPTGYPPPATPVPTGYPFP